MSIALLSLSYFDKFAWQWPMKFNWSVFTCSNGNLGEVLSLSSARFSRKSNFCEMDADNMEMLQTAVATEVNRQQSELLNRLQTMMDFKRSMFQWNIVQISNSQIYKIEENFNEYYSFRKKGNENQFKRQARVWKEGIENVQGL